MSKHTPGPWEWVAANSLYGGGEPGGRTILVGGPGKRFVAATRPDDDDIRVSEEDAALIAAAPEMLALLRDFERGLLDELGRKSVCPNCLSWPHVTVCRWGLLLERLK